MYNIFYIIFSLIFTYLSIGILLFHYLRHIDTDTIFFFFTLTFLLKFYDN